MATVQSEYQKFMSRNAMTLYDFDPNATTATDIAWVDMRDYEGIVFAFFRTIGTSATTLAVHANSASDGSGTDAVIVTKTLTAAEPNAVGDYTFQEVSAEQIANAQTSTTGKLRYVTLVLSFATGTDEGVVVYNRWGAKHAASGLTADSIA
jgi:hypothetical protein